MAEIQIQQEHRAMLARMQHVLEWLDGQRDRLVADLNHVTRQGNEAQGILAAVLHSAYGIAPSSAFTLDAERGVIVTPDPAAEAAAEEPEVPFLRRED